MRFVYPSYMAKLLIFLTLYLTPYTLHLVPYYLKPYTFHLVP